MEWTIVNILTYILNFIIIIIAFYLIFLLIKSQSFKIFPCYNITIISFIILFDNIFRIIPNGDIDALRYIQAFLLTSLDKLLLTTITSQAIITYLGVCKTEMYFSNEKVIFISLLNIGIIISAILALIYLIVEGTIDYGTYDYCHDSMVKRVCDTIFNGVFLLTNLFCTIALLIYISKKTRDAKLGIIEDLDYGHHHTKIIFMFIFNSLIFIESFLIIYDEFPLNEVDLIYLISCLIILFYYTINKIVIRETKRIFCRINYDKEDPSLKNDSITGDEENQRTNSFSDD